MIAYNLNPLCKQSEMYYYDFLAGEDRGDVPDIIVKHVHHCTRCQGQIEGLSNALLEAESCIGLEQKSISPSIIKWFRLQFSYIGKHVTCEAVKPFLPGLLDPALEVKIPTPITAHLDNCQQCQEDLEIIRQMGLNGRQLHRLSELFAEKTGSSVVGSECLIAQDNISAIVAMDFNKTSREALRHICICPDCRRKLYDCREMVRNQCSDIAGESEGFPCDKVSISDLFDYAVPCGMDPVSDQYAKFRKFFTSHVYACPICLTKMQQLHEDVFRIAERTDSGIATIYHMDAAHSKVFRPDDAYTGFPVRIEVAGDMDAVKTEKQVSTVNVFTKRKMASKNVKSLVKIAVSAAAVLLITASLFLSTRTVKAVSLDGIYKAIEKIKNVYVSSFVPDKKEPVREMWVSKTLNVNMIKTDNESVLWDISNKVRKVKLSEGNSIATTMLSAGMIAEIQNTITGALGLMPFQSISEIPSNAEWSRIEDNDSGIVSQGTEIYDLVWIEESYTGHPTFKKWKVFIDSETNLPQKVEFYQKTTVDGGYDLKYTRIVKYLDDREMQEVIKEESF